MVAITGVVKMLDQPDADGVIGTGTFAFTGGTDINAGVVGKATSVMKEDVTTITSCVQRPYYYQ